MDKGNGGDRPEIRERALAEMELLLEATTALRENLEGHEAVCRAVIAGMRRDEPLATVLEGAASRTWRPRLTDSLTTYERLRHRARLRLIALGAAEGMTVADVQYHWSITKQLANRSLREIDQLD
jgi:hypothetical protein